MFTHSNGYWEVYRHFQGDFLVGERDELRGWGYAGELSIEEFVMGEENLHEGAQGFLSLFYRAIKTLI